MLPSNPAFSNSVVIAVDVKAELVVHVVLPAQVAEDGIPFEDGEVVVVVVYDGGDAAVGVDGCEPWFFLDVLANVDGLHGVREVVGLLELLEQDGGFVAVGGALEGELVDENFQCLIFSLFLSL